MAIAPSHGGVGQLLREWRQRRRVSQLDLALDADVSTRHLSFVETGRANPSRELVLNLAGHLDVPLRERNAMLLAAGFAPVYRETPMDASQMAPVQEAIKKILAGHEPFPAIAVDRSWDIVAANGPALAILSDSVAPELLAPPVNALRVSLHPQGLAPRIVNLAEYGGHLIARLHRQVTLTGDSKSGALEAELRAFPGVDGDSATRADPAALVFVPLVLRSGGGTLTFFSTLTTFGTALDVTVAELSIESFFPADAATADALRSVAGLSGGL